VNCYGRVAKNRKTIFNTKKEMNECIEQGYFMA